MSQSVETKVEDLIGEIPDDNATAVTQWATDIAREVINVLPQEMLWQVSEDKDEPGSGVAISTAKFLYAHKSGYKAIEINPADKARADLSGSIYKATTTSPVFYREKGKIHVLPNGGTVNVVAYPTIEYDAADVTGVPDDVKHLVIMGTAVKGRLYQLDHLRRTLDDLTAPSYSEESLALLPIPSIADLSTTENAPALVLEPISLSDLTITATLPSSPNDPVFREILVDKNDAVAPTYNMPTQPISFANAVTQIETNEDVELANAELDKIGTQINEFKTKIDNEVNKFNEQVTKYQTEIQVATQEAQMKQGKDFQAYSAEIEKYQADLNRYQQDVNKQIAEYTTNTLQKDLQVWQQKRNDNMQEYVAKLDLYKTNLSNEKEIYAINEIQKEIGLWQSEQSQRLQKYGADLQQASTKYGSEFQNYQTSINNIFQKHQTMVQELQVLDAQYQRGLATFVSSYREPDKNAKGV